jgi:hypothetical protein
MTTDRITSTTRIDSTWKESTSAPALNPSLAKNICKAQKAENSKTLKSGEVDDVLNALSSTEKITWIC